MSWLFASSCQNTGASASGLPVNIQDWFSFGLTGLIALLSKGPHFKSISSSVLCPPHGLTLTSIESVMPSNYLILCYPLLLPPSIFTSIKVSSKSRLFASGGQSIGASASALVLPVIIQDWFPLGLTVWPSCSPRDPRVFPSTTVQKHQFFSAQPSLWSSSHFCTWLLEKP